MYPRRTLVLLFLLTLAAAAALYHLRRNGAVTDSAAGRRVFPKNLDAVEALVLERGNETLSLQRQKGVWEITRPLAVPADAQRVRRLLDALESLPVTDQFPLRSLEQRQLSLEQLGLAPPQTRITLTLAGRPPVVLEIGRASPSGHALYLRHSGHPSQILTTDAVFLREQLGAFLEFRQRLLLPTLPSKITALEIRRPGQSVFRVIRKDNLWHLVQPISGRANQGVVNELAQTLADLAIEKFIWPETLSDPLSTPQPPPLDAFGLDPESALSLLVWEQAQPSPLRVRIGRPVPENPGLLYTLSTDQATVATVTNAILAILGQPPSEFRDKRLFREDPSLLAGLSIRYPGQTLELENDDSEWLLTAPVRARANTLMVAALVNTLLNLRADKINTNDDADATDPIDSPDSPAPSPIPQPSPLVSRQLLLAFKNQPPVALHFEHTPLHTLFTFANDPAITYLIASTNLPPELVNLDEATHLADLQILDLPSESVQRLTFSTPTATQSFECVNAQWQPAGLEPPPPVFADFQPAVLLDGLASLRAERVAQLTPLLPVQLQPLGLSPPALEITLDLSDSPSFRRVLSIGAPASLGTRHATLRGSEILYAVSTNSLPAFFFMD